MTCLCLRLFWSNGVENSSQFIFDQHACIYSYIWCIFFFDASTAGLRLPEPLLPTVRGVTYVRIIRKYRGLRGGKGRKQNYIERKGYILPARWNNMEPQSRSLICF